MVVYADIFIYESANSRFIQNVETIYTPPRCQYNGIREARVRSHYDMAAASTSLYIAGSNRSKLIDGCLVEVRLVVDDYTGIFEAMHGQLFRYWLGIDLPVRHLVLGMRSTGRWVRAICDWRNCVGR
jgi:hypothetical protein